ncbi:hypothetical protein [Planomicrobium sp. CPCC 101079]|uniref:hypothetical protein n=1 Tax=Planomicrobium sp. CPCC 101079 TaxID=2599618 RepID=UPI0011B3E523|nr:hypothetical protein [Planomicrobium sp. CPCC 101079]TWT04605.1 hypothetical protein FQV28_08355 [Planomicrobium sp. CPCC 101079]
MIEYVDPIPPIRRFFKENTDVHVDANTFQLNITEGLLVRSAGGFGFSRIQMIYRSKDEGAAMSGLISCMNLLEREASSITALQGSWCEREGNPIPSKDEETGAYEAWVYMRFEHIEA